MRKPVSLLAALLFSAAAHAQTASTSLSPAAQQVQLLAPQLIAFSGSTANFDSLVNGITTGAPVTLSTLTPEGLVQIATFVPPRSGLTPLEAARQLETARQNLIVRGVASPTAQQLAVALAGGTLTTLSGSAPISGVLNGATATPIQVRNEFLPFAPAVPGVVAGVGVTGFLNLPPADLQALQNGLAQGSAITLGGTSATGVVAPPVTFTPPGGPLNAFEVNQTLQLASSLLAQQGILNPTPDQIRVALVGGTLTGLNGANIPVRGVLQGRVRFTSESPVVGTSNSPFFGTSNTPPNVAPVISPPPVLGTPGVPASPVGTAEGVRRANTAEGANRVTAR